MRRRTPREADRDYAAALDAAGGNRTIAAEALGVHPVSVVRWVRRLPERLRRWPGKWGAPGHRGPEAPVTPTVVERLERAEAAVIELRARVAPGWLRPGAEVLVREGEARPQAHRAVFRGWAVEGATVEWAGRAWTVREEDIAQLEDQSPGTPSD